MITYTTNPEKFLMLADISVLLESIQSESIFAVSIRTALESNRLSEIVKEIYEQSKDNYSLVCGIVGEKTVLKITKYYEE